jgi:hypothetical protein
MDSELASLATSGASTLVSAMVTDGWTLVKHGFARLFARQKPEQAESIGSELEATRTELLQAHSSGDQTTVAELESEWRSRLRRLLTADQRAQEELRQLLAELAPTSPASVRTSAGSIEMEAKAMGHGKIYQVGHGDMHIGGDE